MDGDDPLFGAQRAPECRVLGIGLRHGCHDDGPTPAAAVAMLLALGDGLHSTGE